MALKTFVKISNVSNLSDARYCAGMMVDVLGFNIDPNSENQISAEDYQELTEWVSGVQFAGEFSTANADQILDTIKTYPVDYIQINNTEVLDSLNDTGKPLILKQTINSPDDINLLFSKLESSKVSVEALILTTASNDCISILDDEIQSYHGPIRLIKGYGLDDFEALGNFPGIELEGTEEERPGYQDYGMVMDVLEALETDD